MTVEEILEHTIRCPSGCLLWLGWEVDHVCARWPGYSLARRRCCEPSHLDCVPGDLNNRRRLITHEIMMNRGE